MICGSKSGIAIEFYQSLHGQSRPTVFCENQDLHEMTVCWSIELCGRRDRTVFKTTPLKAHSDRQIYSGETHFHSDIDSRI
jgi:hypothetical protein